MSVNSTLTAVQKNLKNFLSKKILFIASVVYKLLLSNISTNFRKNSKWSRWFTHVPGGN
jgi:hypothetical protein